MNYDALEKIQIKLWEFIKVLRKLIKSKNFQLIFQECFLIN